MKLYALLQCWYEGDSNLVDDSLVGVFSTVTKAEAAVPHEEGVEVQVFRPGQNVPDDGQYADKRRRYRIVPVTVDCVEHISQSLSPDVSKEAGDGAETNAPAVAQKSPQAGGSDSDRLDWLLRNVSGAELHRIGIFYSAGCTRSDVDRAMSPNAPLSRSSAEAAGSARGGA